MNNTSIEWTDRSWNPVSGCTKVSAGCKHCYAEIMHERWNGKGSFKKVTCHPDRLDQPIKIKKPQRIFVNSMSDLFHEDVPSTFIMQVFNVMARCEHHTFQILTKRPKRMLDFCKYIQYVENGPTNPFGYPYVYHGSTTPAGNPRGKATLPPNVWLGVSVENQAAAEERIPLLIQIPAAVRFLSCEPLIGSVDLVKPAMFPNERTLAPKSMWLHHINWVIVGGESGNKARPMHPDWARSLRDQCEEHQVYFFFKQWGAFTPSTTCDGIDKNLWWVGRESGEVIKEMKDLHFKYPFDYHELMVKIGKKKSGSLLDGKTHTEMPATTYTMDLPM